MLVGQRLEGTLAELDLPRRGINLQTLRKSRNSVSIQQLEEVIFN